MTQLVPVSDRVPRREINEETTGHPAQCLRGRWQIPFSSAARPPARRAFLILTPARHAQVLACWNSPLWRPPHGALLAGQPHAAKGTEAVSAPRHMTVPLSNAPAVIISSAPVSLCQTSDASGIRRKSAFRRRRSRSPGQNYTRRAPSIISLCSCSHPLAAEKPGCSTELSQEDGLSLLNLDLLLGDPLLGVPVKRRGIEAPGCSKSGSTRRTADRAARQPRTLLRPVAEPEPAWPAQALCARTRVILATWAGHILTASLMYARAGHPILPRPRQRTC